MVCGSVVGFILTLMDQVFSSILYKNHLIGDTKQFDSLDLPSV